MNSTRTTILTAAALLVAVLVIAVVARLTAHSVDMEPTMEVVLPQDPRPIHRDSARACRIVLEGVVCYSPELLEARP